MILVYLVLFSILLISPRIWFRWWHFNRFTAYAWGMMVFMACFGIVYVGFGDVYWGRTLGLFGLVFILTIARNMHARKREIEEQEAAEAEQRSE